MPCRSARFALTEVTLGIMPGAGGTQFLPRAVGERRAKEIILTGRPFSAEEACDWGLVNRVVRARGADGPRSSRPRPRLRSNAPLAVRQAKKSIHAGLQLDLRNGLLFEIEAYNRLVPTADRHEGIRAFNEKRKPRFTGNMSDPSTRARRGLRRNPRRRCAASAKDFRAPIGASARPARNIPTNSSSALTEAGYLGALIPERYGGSGLPLRAASVILEEIHASGCNAGACHAQMYIMGTLLRHGSEAQKAQYLPKIAAGELRLQAFGVTEPTTGSDTTQLKTRAERRGNDRYVVRGQKVWTSRALQSDLMLLLARTTPADQVKRRGDGLSVFLVDLREARGKGLEIRPLEGHDQPQRQRDFLRRRRGAGRESASARRAKGSATSSTA